MSDPRQNLMERFAALEGDSAIEAARPAMWKVSSVYLRSEDGVDLIDVSDEVVAFARLNRQFGTWAVEIHFGLRRARSGFVGHRYDVDVPFGATTLSRQAAVEDGYQLAGTLEIVGRIVIDDPLTRPKPPRNVQFIPSSPSVQPEPPIP